MGGGGREHALGWSLLRSPHVDTLVSAPGNPGLSRLGETIPDLPATDPAAVTEVAVGEAVDLVVIGPEAPLAAGVGDALHRAGVPVFGPTQRAARLEASKSFANDVMARAGVPTGAANVFTDPERVAAHLDAVRGPFVVKADGLAAGKGVLVTEDRAAAQAWAQRLLGGDLGEAGAKVVVEEYLDGREVSVFAICDGTTLVPLEPARDYKRQLDGDEGPNTGGMGCFSPVPDLPDDLVGWTAANVMQPVLNTMAGDGTPFTGFLYAGLMLTDDGPKVLEFNVRLGDPETQVVLPRLDGDLFELLYAAAAGTLDDMPPPGWHATAAVNVVLASEGYPEAPVTGRVIQGLDEAAGNDVLVFHAGTRRDGDTLVTSGGRVLSVVGLGDDIAAARSRAYAAAHQIDFEGRQFRTDIAGVPSQTTTASKT